METKAVLTFGEFEKRCESDAEILERNLHDPRKTPQEWDFVCDLNAPLEDGRRPFALCDKTGESGLYMAARFSVGDDRWSMPLLKLELLNRTPKKEMRDTAQAPDTPQE